MTNFIARIALYFSILFLNACVLPGMTVQGKKDFENCKKICENRLSACAKTCHNNCRHCFVKANQSTAASYLRYVRECRLRGNDVVLLLNSFRDPLQCRKTTCNCSSDYQICMQSCGGVIYKSLQVAPLCC